MEREIANTESHLQHVANGVGFFSHFVTLMDYAVCFANAFRKCFLHVRMK